MIYYITRFRGTEGMKRFLASPYGERLRDRVRIVAYERLFRFRSLPLGTYIFADFDQLTPDETTKAGVIRNTLSADGRATRLLNDPVRSLRRFELLRRLAEARVNDFNAFRLTDTQRPQRYPVFLRREQHHDGALTPLLHSPEELESAIDSLAAAGHSRDDKLIVEFCDVSDVDGIYHYYSALIVGAAIIPIDLSFGTDWMDKGPINEHDLARLEEIKKYVHGNPHEDQLRAIFQLAGIEYGRIDYSVVGNQLRVFEINSNPTLLDPKDVHEPGGPDASDDSVWTPTTRFFATAIAKALDVIDSPTPNPPAIRFDPPTEFWWASSRRNRLTVWIRNALWTVRLHRFEEPILDGLQRIYRGVRPWRRSGD